MSNSDLQKALDDAASKLGEHFSSVLILASRTDTDAESPFTDGFKAGTGDYYARRGMAHVYLEKQKAELIAKAGREES